VLDLTFLKMVIANTLTLSCFYDEWSEWLCNMYNKPPAVWCSSR